MPVWNHLTIRTRGLILLSIALSLSCAGPAAGGSVPPDNPGHERQGSPKRHEARPPVGPHNERRPSPVVVPTDNRPDKFADVDTDRLRDLERELAGDLQKTVSDRNGERPKPAY